MPGSFRADPSRALAQFRARWRAATDEEAVAAACGELVGSAARFGAVDPIAIAGNYGARVVFSPWGERTAREHGRLSVHDRRWRIDVPVELTAERRRFSVAHEIGHILLLDSVADQPELVRELGSAPLHRRIERLCNFAAAHILMPDAAVRAALSEHPGLDRDSLPQFASQFFVSYEAMARRVSEVSDRWSLIMWEWRSDHPNGPAWRTAKYQDRSGRIFIPDGMSSRRLTPDVVAAAAADAFAASDVVRFEGRTLGTLFDVRAWRNRRVAAQQLVEEPSAQPSQPKVFVLAHFR